MGGLFFFQRNKILLRESSARYTLGHTGDRFSTSCRATHPSSSANATAGPSGSCNRQQKAPELTNNRISISHFTERNAFQATGSFFSLKPLLPSQLLPKKKKESSRERVINRWSVPWPSYEKKLDPVVVVFV